jgi:hypothetical protein
MLRTSLCHMLTSLAQDPWMCSLQHRLINSQNSSDITTFPPTQPGHHSTTPTTRSSSWLAFLRPPSTSDLTINRLFHFAARQRWHKLVSRLWSTPNEHHPLLSCTLWTIPQSLLSLTLPFCPHLNPFSFFRHTGTHLTFLVLPVGWRIFGF